MKTTVYKEIEVNVSAEEAAKDIIEELEYDEYAVADMVQDYLIEELPDYVFSKLEEKYSYDEEDEEYDKVCELVLPKLREIYTKKVEEYKKSEIEDNLSDRESILAWLDGISGDSYFLSSEDILDAILANGTKSRT